MKLVSFTKMAGAGNDFVMIDNRQKTIIHQPSRLAKKLSHRRLSIGSDGLILLEKSKKADLKMRYFNADGSEADMCGNGIRCLAKFAVDKKIAGAKHSIETAAGIYRLEVKKNIVRVQMVEPKDLKINIPINVDGHKYVSSFVNTGVPHAVLMVKDLESIPVDALGRKIRFHDAFKPKGANVNFITLGSGSDIHARIYERGVEAETLASGTGATACALIAVLHFNLKSPVKVHTRSGEIIKIYFKRAGSHFMDVEMEGPVTTSFEGKVEVA